MAYSSEDDFLKSLDPVDLIERMGYVKSSAKGAGGYRNAEKDWWFSIKQNTDGHWTFFNSRYATNSPKASGGGSIIDFLLWTGQASTIRDAFDKAREYGKQKDPVESEKWSRGVSKQAQVKRNIRPVDLNDEVLLVREPIELNENFDRYFIEAQNYEYLEARGIGRDTYASPPFKGTFGNLPREQFLTDVFRGQEMPEDLKGEDFAFDQSLVFPFTNVVETGIRVHTVDVKNRFSVDGLEKMKQSSLTRGKDPDSLTASHSRFASRSSRKFSLYTSVIPVKPEILIVGEQPFDLMSYYQLSDEKELLNESAIFIGTGGTLTESQQILINDIIAKYEIKELRLAFDNDIHGMRYGINVATKSIPYIAPNATVKFITRQQEGELIVDIAMRRMKGQMEPNKAELLDKLSRVKKFMLNFDFKDATLVPAPSFTNGNRLIGSLVFPANSHNYQQFITFSSKALGIGDAIKPQVLKEGFKDWNDQLLNKKTKSETLRSLINSPYNKLQKDTFFVETKRGDISILVRQHVRGVLTPAADVVRMNKLNGFPSYHVNVFEGDWVGRQVDSLRGKWNNEVGFLNPSLINEILTRGIRYDNKQYLNAQGYLIATQNGKDIHFDKNNSSPQDERIVYWMADAVWKGKDPNQFVLSSNSSFYLSAQKFNNIATIMPNYTVQLRSGITLDDLPDYISGQIEILNNHLAKMAKQYIKFNHEHGDSDIKLDNLYLKSVTIKPGELEIGKGEKMNKEQLLAKMTAGGIDQFEGLFFGPPETLIAKLYSENNRVLVESRFKDFLPNYVTDLLMAYEESGRIDVLPGQLFEDGSKILLKEKGKYTPVGEFIRNKNKEVYKVVIHNENLIGLKEILGSLTGLRVSQYAAHEKLMEADKRAEIKEIVNLRAEMPQGFYVVREPDPKNPTDLADMLRYKELIIGRIEDGYVKLNAPRLSAPMIRHMIGFEMENIEPAKWQWATKLDEDETIQENLSQPAEKEVELDPKIVSLLKSQIVYDTEMGDVFIKTGNNENDVTLLGTWNATTFAASENLFTKSPEFKHVINEVVYPFLRNEFDISHFQLKTFDSHLNNEQVQVPNELPEVKVDRSIDKSRFIKDSWVLKDILRDPKFSNIWEDYGNGVKMECLTNKGRNILTYGDNGLNFEGNDSSPLYVSKTEYSHNLNDLVFAEGPEQLLGFYYQGYPQSRVDCNTIYTCGKGIDGMDFDAQATSLNAIMNAKNINQIQLVGCEDFLEKMSQKFSGVVVLQEVTDDKYLNLGIQQLHYNGKHTNIHPMADQITSVVATDHFKNVAQTYDGSFLFPYINAQGSISGFISYGKESTQSGTHEGLYISRPPVRGDSLHVFASPQEMLAYSISEKQYLTKNKVFACFDGNVTPEQVQALKSQSKALNADKVFIANTCSLSERIKEMGFDQPAHFFNPDDNQRTFQQALDNKNSKQKAARQEIERITAEVDVPLQVLPHRYVGGGDQHQSKKHKIENTL